MKLKPFAALAALFMLLTPALSLSLSGCATSTSTDPDAAAKVRATTLIATCDAVGQAKDVVKPYVAKMSASQVDALDAANESSHSVCAQPVYDAAWSGGTDLAVNLALATASLTNINAIIVAFGGNAVQVHTVAGE